MKAFCLFAPSVLFFLSCGAPAARLDETRTGLDGLDPKSTAAAACTVKESGGTFTMTCPDGTKVTWRDGETGATGDTGPAGPGGTDGSDGAAGTSITAAVEAPGSHCIAGGISVWSNATQPASIVQYVCAGENGSSCSVFDNGNDTYTMTCTNGTNVTWDNQGSTSANPWVPGGVLYGYYKIENSLDVAFLAGVTAVTGGLDIRNWNGSITSLSLPSLGWIGEWLYVASNNGLADFSLPATYVGRYFEVVANPGLKNFSTSMQVVGEYVRVASNGALFSFTLANLTTVGGQMTIENNALLNAISAPALTSVTSNLTVRNNLALCNNVATALADQLLKPYTYITGNTGTCP